MGIAAAGAGAILPLSRLHVTATVAIVAAAGLDLLTPEATGQGVIAVRAGAGLAKGVLVWLTIGLIARSPEPPRQSGLYLAAQTVAQLAVATGLALVVVPLAGARGGFLALAGVTAIGLAALPWLPRRYRPLDDGAHGADGRIAASGAVALAGVVAYLAFTVAVWVYVEPLAAERGVGGRALAAIAPLSLAAQVVGAGVATLLAGRWRAVPTLLATGGANLILLAVMGTTASAAAFLVATTVFGFLWLFALPFQIASVIAADPSRRAATLIGGAQLIGASAGPFLAATIVGKDTVQPVLWFGGACVVGSSLLTLWSIGRRSGSYLSSSNAKEAR